MEHLYGISRIAYQHIRRDTHRQASEHAESCTFPALRCDKQGTLSPRWSPATQADSVMVVPTDRAEEGEEGEAESSGGCH